MITDRSMPTRNARAVNIQEEEHDGATRSIVRLLATNTEVDFYNTIMGDSSLANYAQDAKNGITFTDSHNHRTTGYGWSVDGERIGDDLFIDVAILHEDQWQGLTYAKGEDLIFALRHRPFDVSIGITGGRVLCSICSENIWSSKCEHWLGEETLEDGKKVTVYGIIEDAHLTEVSLVYDGATPGAGTELNTSTRALMTEKATHLIQSGQLTPDQLNAFCQRMKIPELDIPQPQPTRSRPMPKSIEGLERRNESLTETIEDLNEVIEDLREEVSNYREQRADDRKQIKALRDELKSKRDIEYAMGEIEDAMRHECYNIFLNNGELKDEPVSEEKKTQQLDKLAAMNYKALKNELENLSEQRDILEAMKSKQDQDAADEPTPDEADKIPSENGLDTKVFVQQPFLRSI